MKKKGKNAKVMVVSKPQCGFDYNNAKKGVDISDQLASYQNPLKRTKRWYKKVGIYTTFSVALLNSFSLYNQLSTEKMSWLEYRENIINSMLFCNEEIRQQKQQPTARKRSTEEMHLLGYLEHRGEMCAECKDYNHMPTTCCLTCDISLCFKNERNCYHKYHKKLNK